MAYVLCIIFAVFAVFFSCSPAPDEKGPGKFTEALERMEAKLLKGLIRSYEMEVEMDLSEIQEVVRLYLPPSHHEALKKALQTIQEESRENLEEASVALLKKDLESCRAFLAKTQKKLEWRDRILAEHLDAAERKLGEEVLRGLSKKLDI